MEGPPRQIGYVSLTIGGRTRHTSRFLLGALTAVGVVLALGAGFGLAMALGVPMVSVRRSGPTRKVPSHATGAGHVVSSVFDLGHRC